MCVHVCGCVGVRRCVSVCTQVTFSLIHKGMPVNQTQLCFHGNKWIHTIETTHLCCYLNSEFLSTASHPAFTHVTSVTNTALTLEILPKPHVNSSPYSCKGTRGEGVSSVTTEYRAQDETGVPVRSPQETEVRMWGPPIVLCHLQQSYKAHHYLYLSYACCG